LQSDLSQIINLSMFIAVLFGISGFCSGSEAAIFSLSQNTIKKLEESGYRSARYITYLLNDPEKLLITIIFANLFVNTLISSIATILAIDVARYLTVSDELCATVGTILTTYIIILVCEVTPINVAIVFSEGFSRMAAYPVYILTIFFSKVIPVIPIIKYMNKLVMPYFGIEAQPATTEQEIKSAINIGEREGTIEPHEKHMIHSIFEFGDTITKEVMTPRIDMTCVRSDCTIENMFKMFKDSSYSRLPVYENSLDNIIGIIHAKDLLAYMKDQQANKTSSIKPIIRQAYFVPETKNIDSLLKELQLKKVQMAIVVDEYGGTEGLITMEDIIEEIVGEILDEYDEDEKLFEKIDMNTFKVDPKITVSEFNSLMDANIPEELFDTLGGLLYDLIGHVPHPGEEVTFENLKFKIIQVEGKRIKKALIKRRAELKPPDDEQADNAWKLKV